MLSLASGTILRGVRPERLIQRLRSGHVHNVRFDDLVRLARALGFQVARISGSHHILVHDDVAHPLNLQEVRGRAKPYQVRQMVALIERYHLELRG